MLSCFLGDRMGFVRLTKCSLMCFRQWLPLSRFRNVSLALFGEDYPFVGLTCALAALRCSASIIVVDIVLLRTPLKILYAIVGLDFILMVDNRKIIRIWNEGLGNKSMYVRFYDISVFLKSKAEISIAIHIRLSKAVIEKKIYPSKRGNHISSLKSTNRLPYLAIKCDRRVEFFDCIGYHILFPFGRFVLRLNEVFVEVRIEFMTTRRIKNFHGDDFHATIEIRFHKFFTVAPCVIVKRAACNICV